MILQHRPSTHSSTPLAERIRQRAGAALASAALLLWAGGAAAQESARQYCERQPDHVRDICLRELAKTEVKAAPAPAARAPAAGSESERQYCERQPAHVRDICLRELAKAKPAAASARNAETTGGSETEREYCERQPAHVREICLRGLDRKTKAASQAAAPTPAAPAPPIAKADAGAAAGAKPYQVKDGFRVDAETYKGFKTWRAAACDRCHGANQEGLVGPSLLEGMKVLTKAEFNHVVTEGRLEKGMPAFKTHKMAMANLDALYAYLKGRSDGAITKAQVEPMRSE